MKAEDFYAPSQRYSHSLRVIAKLIETRRSDSACVAEITAFLRKSNVPVRDGGGPAKKPGYGV